MSIDTNTISRRCDEAIAEFRLLDHSFYRRWTEGTLPVAALRDYAREYGAFIGQIGRGWESIGKPEIGRIEDGHARVWEKTFARSFATSVSEPQTMEVVELLSISRHLFSERATALGALYAIEAQQPVVAEAKIKGLREHYSHLPDNCAEYFRLHCEDYDELKALRVEMAALDSEEGNRTVEACRQMAVSLHNALTGIETPYPEPLSTAA